MGLLPVSGCFYKGFVPTVLKSVTADVREFGFLN